MAESYEFLDCSTINIAYQSNGLATISFTVVSTEEVPGVNPSRDFTQLTLGGIDFKGYISNLTSALIPASIPPVFEHRFTLIATGCASDCPRAS